MIRRPGVIRKAVFPVAGLGTRFLPATKASPKEMMPIVDKPLVQYAVEEAAAAGITDMIFVTGRNKRAIEDHFDKAYEMENELLARGDQRLVEVLHAVLPAGCRCIYIRQSEPLGLGHAVLCAAPVVGDDPFAVVLADDLIHSTTPVLKQMVDVFSKERCSVLGVEDVPKEQTGSYGIVSPISGGKLSEISSIVEKPESSKAPSTLAVVGRYVLSSKVFNHLSLCTPGRGGELQLTDGILRLLSEERVLAYRFEGRRYDCGSKLGYLKASIELGLLHPEIGSALREYLESRT